MSADRSAKPGNASRAAARAAQPQAHRRPGADARPGDPADVRAGPGDAGAQARPQTLPGRGRGDRGGWGRVIAVLGAGLAIGLILAAAFA